MVRIGAGEEALERISERTGESRAYALDPNLAFGGMPTSSDGTLEVKILRGCLKGGILHHLYPLELCVVCCILNMLLALYS